MVSQRELWINSIKTWLQLFAWRGNNMGIFRGAQKPNKSTLVGWTALNEWEDHFETDYDD